MNSLRNIRKSALARVRALLEAPPSESGLASAYSVYGIEAIRQLANRDTSFTPVRPYAFAIEGRVEPVQPALPLIMVMARAQYEPIELGRVTGGWAEIEVHVVGRFSGESADLADLFARHWGRAMPIYNYSAGSQGSLLERAVVDPKVATWDVVLADRAVRDTGLYDYWEAVGLRVMFIK